MKFKYETPFFHAQMAQFLEERKPGFKLLLKKGGQGSSVIDYDISDPTGLKELDCPAVDFANHPNMSLVDTTGAGDTFTAAFAVKLSEKKLALGEQPLTDADYMEC